MQLRMWVAAIAAVGMCAVPTTAGAEWLPAQTVGGGGEPGPNWGSVPQVAMNARGDAAVTTGPEDAPLALATRPAGGAAFGSVALPFTSGELSQTFTDLALGADGTVLLGLRFADGVRMTTGPLAGPLQPPTTVTSDPWPDAAGPQLAVADDGTVVAVWGLDVGFNSVIRWSVKPPGGTWGPVQGNGTDHSASLGSVSVSPDGHALITYVAYDNASGGTVYAVSRDPGGQFGAPERVSADGDQLSWRPTGALAAGGAAVVAYGSSDQMVIVHRASASAPWSPRDTAATGATSAPSIVLDDHGNFVLAYAHDLTKATLLTGRADGTHDAPVDLGQATVPALAMAGDGTATAVYSTFSDARLYAMRRPAGGAWGTPEAIDDASDRTQFVGGQIPAASVAADAAGDAVVGWVAYSGAYRVRLFDAPVPAGDDGGHTGDGGHHDDGHHEPPHHGPSRPRCVVPVLTNHTLAGAKAMLRRAHCTLGTTTTPKRLRHHRHLVVRHQSRRAHTRATAGAKVSVTLGIRPSKARGKHSGRK
jgi:hypothetical protein